MGATNLLARSYRVQVSLDEASWLTLMGMNDFNPSVTPNEQDSTDYESDGWQSSEITMQAWALSVKANAKATTGVLDPAMSMILACIGEFGDDARVYVRWFRKDGVTGFPSYQGRAIVKATPSKTAVADLNEYQVDLTGDGMLSKIANPFTPDTEDAPVVLSATPPAAAAASLLQITGANFTGTIPATGVKVGGTAATPFTVVSDSVIIATMPAGAAGSAPIVITNGTGPSNSFDYTRGA